MGIESAQAGDSARIRRAAAKVIEDASFRRSPVLSKLLEYLVNMTSEGKPLKSYTIAVDGLGKARDELADADTYARVAVARLRRTLVSYYADHPDDEEIYIDTGSYKVCLRTNAEAKSSVPSRLQSASKHNALLDWPDQFGSKHWRYWIGLIAVVLLVGFLFFSLNRHDEETWTRSNFPTIAIIANESEFAKRRSDAENDIFHNALREKLKGYIGFRLMESAKLPTDFEIRLDVDLREGGAIETITLVQSKTDRLIWSAQYTLAEPEDIDHFTALAAQAIATPGGALNNFGRKGDVESDSPYGCWLRFTESVQTYTSIADDRLYECAEDWYSAAGDDPVAAFLRNWTLVSHANTQLTLSARQAELQEALNIIHRSQALNPDNAMLYLAEMRTYSFIGERDMVHEAAMSAIAKAADNRVVVGMAGCWLAFWNDPQGLEILETLDSDSRSAFPWEHAGRFVSAMMEDDVQSAGRQLIYLRTYMSGQPSLHLLEAAYLGRTGKLKEAEAELDAVAGLPQSWIVGKADFVARLPVAPEVKTRLDAWISYRSNQGANGPGSLE